MRIAIGIALVLAASTVARADDTFERKANAAVPVNSFEDVVWALTAPCDKGDELHQRQCRLIRDTRAKQLTGATLLVDAEPGAFVAGPWNPAKRSVPLVLEACIRCGGVQVDGRTWHLTGSTAHMNGTKLSAAALYDNARPFPDEARAKKWIAGVKAARTQMVLKVPDKRRWLVGGNDGLLFEVLAWRVVQPCTGEVVISSLPSGPAEKDRAACSAAAQPAATQPAASEPAVVPMLTKEMVRAAMKPVVQGARACYAKYKAAGKARLELAIRADGSLDAYTQSGDFKGTPTGLCIDAAMLSVAFPPSQRPVTTVGYPIVLP